MPSVVEICNLSLAHIGQGSINSLDEVSSQAEQCNLFFTNTRDSLLRQFPWNFSTKSVALAQVATEIPGWNYVYSYPPETLWLRKVYSKDNTDPEIPNEFEITSTGIDKYICCDIFDAYAKCTIRVEDTSLYDPLFIDVLAFKLALDLIMPLTNSSTRTQEIVQKYQTALSQAMICGAVEGSNKRSVNNKVRSSRAYINARGGYSYGY
jgi:hypothetical protein